MKRQVVGYGAYYLADFFFYGDAVDEIEEDLFDLFRGAKGEDVLDLFGDVDQVHVGDFGGQGVGGGFELMYFIFDGG